MTPPRRLRSISPECLTYGELAKALEILARSLADERSILVVLAANEGEC